MVRGFAVKMIDKPKIGEPCNGCGLCCRIQVCRNGAYLQGLVRTLGDTVAGPCPALTTKEDGTQACGIVLNAKKYIRKSKYREDVLRRSFMVLIGAGDGCDEPGEDPTPEEDAALDAHIEKIKNEPGFLKKVTEAMRIIHNR